MSAIASKSSCEADSVSSAHFGEADFELVSHSLDSFGGFADAAANLLASFDDELFSPTAEFHGVP